MTSPAIRRDAGRSSASISGAQHERPLAVVVPTDAEEPPKASELQAFLEPRIAKWWMPDDFVFIEELPKTGTRKFDKKVLRQQFAGG